VNQDAIQDMQISQDGSHAITASLDKTAKVRPQRWPGKRGHLYGLLHERLYGQFHGLLHDTCMGRFMSICISICMGSLTSICIGTCMDIFMGACMGTSQAISWAVPRAWQ